MVIGAAGPLWSVTTASAVGSSHRATDAPNQDAVATFETDHGLVVAIADGHGGKRYVRSAVGSGFAVAIAQRLGLEVLGAPAPMATAVAGLPASIVAQWRAAVADDLSRTPLSPDDRAVVGADPVVAYGTTLLLVLFRASEVVALQLGDGDIVVAWRGGPVLRPMPPDPRNVGGQTMSLCLPDAATSFRVAQLASPSGPPDLVLAATDGYGNSFADPNWPQHAATDLLEQHRVTGDAAIATALPQWVSESAAVGGDDTTVALVFARTDVAQLSAPPGSAPAVAPVPSAPAMRSLPVAPAAPRAERRPTPSRRAPALGMLAVVAMLLVGAGAFAVGRSSAKDPPAAQPTIESPSSTLATQTVASLPTVTAPPSLAPTTTSARVAPTTAVPTTTITPATTLPPPPPTMWAVLPGEDLDPRVRLVMPGYVVDVDLVAATATYDVAAADAVGAPTRAVSSVGGWWTIGDEGTLLLQRSGSDDPQPVISGDDRRGHPVALATSAGLVLVALVVAMPAQATLTVLVFDARGEDPLRPLLTMPAAFAGASQGGFATGEDGSSPTTTSPTTSSVTTLSPLTSSPTTSSPTTAVTTATTATTMATSEG